jgi:hypothetical protein
MSEALYKIKPLKWKKHFSKDLQEYTAENVLGNNMRVWRMKFKGKWTPWHISSRMDNYKSAPHGMRVVGIWYLERLLPALQKVKP